MFDFLKRHIHESIEEQRKELGRYPTRQLMLEGEDCDMLHGATGSFGRCPTNPIPVNGLLGTYKYLGKLSVPSGSCFYFHRVCSSNNPLGQYPLDVYEMVSIDASHWDLLFVDIFHPRRSNKAPKGLILHPYIKEIGDIPFTYGVDCYVEDFPHALPKYLAKHNPMESFARKAAENLSQRRYNRPPEHLRHLSEVKVVPHFVVTEDSATDTRFYVNPQRKLANNASQRPLGRGTSEL